jgi:hypothetical protein
MTEDRKQKTENRGQRTVFMAVMLLFCIGLFGCGYSNESLYPQKVSSVYVEMFDNRSFWRGVEYKLTDALAKRIEAQTPYKVVSSRDRADSVINGQIVSIDQAKLSTERQTGRPLEKEVLLEVVVSWKDIKTGQLLMNNQTVNASAAYSEWQSQSFEYASALAANKLAQQIVEQMEIGW